MPPSKKTLNLSLPESTKSTLRHPLKIAIVGCHPETWEKAPYGDSSWTIWGFSRKHMGKLPRVDKWFELHDPAKFESYERDVHGYKEYLKNPFVVLRENFPKDDLIKSFGSFFFSSGQAPWLMAYAISLNPEAIGLWGINPMETHYFQRYDLQHFAQICHDRGIDFVIPEGCQVLNAYKSYL